MEEIWKEIPNSKSYAVSNLGKVKRLEYLKLSGNKQWIVKEKILKSSNLNSKKYWRIRIFYKNDTQRMESVHRLVGICFIPNINNYPQINHINMNKNDNSVGNLEWCTNAYNIQQSYLLSNRKEKILRGEKSPVNKYPETLIKQIETLSQAGEKAINIAKKLNIPPSLIGEIKRGKAWKHLNLQIKNNRFTQVIQKDKFGVFIKKHDSITKAAKEINGSAGNIGMCISGIRKYHKGFIWEKSS